MVVIAPPCALHQRRCTHELPAIERAIHGKRPDERQRVRQQQTKSVAGTRCPGCGTSSLIRQDGCRFCTARGYTVACG
ncbi:MAG: hypothetical protein ACOZJZ_20435 [Pseudomonadota bacterium]